MAAAATVVVKAAAQRALVGEAKARVRALHPPLTFSSLFPKASPFLAVLGGKPPQAVRVVAKSSRSLQVLSRAVRQGEEQGSVALLHLVSVVA